ncbi:hypothetical protein EYF80_023856 [Liparis tanakae]|uniref:Uncharacterized protein n=1 Tax=Liparis tanakae TaxID=230148 RepID=A0A4Z2HJC1_9TELE|nr:hypothetical protein EYF80_023856 [Liparis tanakae]
MNPLASRRTMAASLCAESRAVVVASPSHNIIRAVAGTPGETQALIDWRAANESLFTGRRNSSKTGWDRRWTYCPLVVPEDRAQRGTGCWEWRRIA